MEPAFRETSNFPPRIAAGLAQTGRQGLRTWLPFREPGQENCELLCLTRAGTYGVMFLNFLG